MRNCEVAIDAYTVYYLIDTEQWRIFFIVGYGPMPLPKYATDTEHDWKVSLWWDLNRGPPDFQLVALTLSYHYTHLEYCNLVIQLFTLSYLLSTHPPPPTHTHTHPPTHPHTHTHHTPTPHTHTHTRTHTHTHTHTVHTHTHPPTHPPTPTHPIMKIIKDCLLNFQVFVFSKNDSRSKISQNGSNKYQQLPTIEEDLSWIEEFSETTPTPTKPTKEQED